MINLATCTRPELAEAYLEAVKERDYWREFAHDLEIKLQEHEGIIKPSNSEMENEFQKFWGLYGRKGNLKQTRRRWFNLSDKKRALAMDKVDAYVKSTPEKCYRKNGEAWINQEGWNDEIIQAANPYGRPDVVRGVAVSSEDEEKKLVEAKKLREANRGGSIRDRLNIN